VQISDLCIEFSRNLAEANDKLWFERGQLAGLPDDFVDSLTKGALVVVVMGTGCAHDRNHGGVCPTAQATTVGWRSACRTRTWCPS